MFSLLFLLPMWNEKNPFYLPPLNQAVTLSKSLPSNAPLEKKDYLFYQWLSVYTMQKDHKMPPFKRGTSKVAIALLQALSCL
jgi:hypothetical protein